MKKIFISGFLIAATLAIIGCSGNNDLQTINITKAQTAELYNAAGTTPMGKADAPITMVEIFAYDCRYCRKDYPMVVDFVKSHPNVRIIFKPFKAFGERTQVLPQYASLAATQQGQFLAMHNAMMTTNRHINMQLIDRVAKELGMNTAKLHAAMESSAIHQQIEKNTDLMNDLSINGIPTVIMTQTRVTKDPSLSDKVPQYIQTGFISNDNLSKMVDQVAKDLQTKN